MQWGLETKIRVYPLIYAKRNIIHVEQGWTILVNYCVRVSLSITSPTSDLDNTNLESIDVDLELDDIALFAYIPHDPIYIDEDSDFSAWPGVGTPSNPKIIENLYIDSNGTATPCIYITGITVRFVIRNCYLTGASLPSGV